MVGGLIAGGLVPKWYIWYICSLNPQNSTPLHQQNRRIFFSLPPRSNPGSASDFLCKQLQMASPEKMCLPFGHELESDPVLKLFI